MMGGIAAVIAAVLVAMLILSGGDLGYTVRVLSHGDSDTDDVTWKAQQPIATADPAAQTAAAGCEPFEDAVGTDLPTAFAHDGPVGFVVVRVGTTVRVGGSGTPRRTPLAAVLGQQDHRLARLGLDPVLLG